jgi:hypothetical protein
MHSQKWLKSIRFFLGFLLAPAIVPYCLCLSLDLVTRQLASSPGVQVNDVGMLVLGMFVLNVGMGLAYFGALCFGLPYVLAMSHKNRLTFRTIMAPTAVLSFVYGGIVYVSLVSDYSFAGIVTVLSVPTVILSGLSFYFISVWSPLDSKAIKSRQPIE